MTHPEPHDHKSCCGHDHPADPGVGDAPGTPSSVLLDAEAKGSVWTTLRVTGMDCADEVEALQQAFKPLKGVREARVNLVGGKVTVLHDGGVTPVQLIGAVARTGMKAALEGEPGIAPDGAKWVRAISVAVSGVFTGLGLLVQWTRIAPPTAADASFGIAIAAGAWFVVPKAWRALQRLALDMNVLMTIAVAGAVVIGEWSEGAAVAFLFSLAEMLEAFSLGRARKAVQALLTLAPATALLRDATGFREVPVEEVAVGSTVAVRSGSRVPLDGEVITGRSAVDQSPITGESMPVEKGLGSPVFAGSINGEGSLEIRTTKPYTDTTLSRIIHLVEEAQSHKAPAQRFVDRFARCYTPAVMLAALLVTLVPPLLLGAAWPTWFYRGLVLLVIACPCALVIATPVSVVSGLTAMARRGVLIKGGAVLEAVGKLRALAVDKTGTITEGRPRVTRIIPVNGTPEVEILRVAAAINTHSEHPLARAVTTHAKDRGVAFPRSESYLARLGRGADGIIEGHPFFVGNHRFAHESGVCTPEIERLLEGIEADAQSVVIVGHRPHQACGGGVLGILAVGDALRSDAPGAVAALHRTGVRRIVMLSGDNQRTVDAVARRAGIDEAYGDLLPEQKTARVQALVAESRHVGMIGDGVNDAPAMAVASVGIAMGGVGTDAAIETADMILMQDDLGKVAEAIRLGRKTVGIIQFNIGFALALKALFLILAVFGYTSLWLAILADTGATLLVIANALRLLKAPKL